MDRQDFNEQLATAAREMVEEDGTQTTLDRAVRMATDIIADCDMAGITLVRNGVIETPSASDELLRKIDQLQFELGEGPCRDALREQDVVVARDLANDPRWPTWGPRIAEELGLHASLSFRLFTTGRDLGSLNLYSRRPGGFVHEDVDEGHALAAHAAVALAGSLRADSLRTGMETRTVIGQAQGILMERFGLDAERAFEVMRRVSSHTNRKLHNIAAELVDTRRTPGTG